MSLDRLRTKYRRLIAESERLDSRAPVHRVLSMVLEDLDEWEAGGLGDVPETLSTREAANYWGVTAKTVARWCAEGRVEGAFKSSGHPRARWRLPAETVYRGPPPPAGDGSPSALSLLRRNG